jgi:hypothetical protein
MEWKKRIYVAWLGIFVLTVLALFLPMLQQSPKLSSIRGILAILVEGLFGPKSNHRSRLKPQLCIAGRVLNLPFDHGGYQW